MAGSFPETDETIDARPYALEGGETNPAYVSAHRVEALLFRDEDLDAALPVARGSVASTRRLEGDLRRREAFSAGQTFEGMIGLADEIASKKISSEEETWSDQSLLIFHRNWLGTSSQYAPFAPAVAAADPDAAATVDAALAAAVATIAAHPPAADGAFPPYGVVPAADRGRIVRASYGLALALTAAGRTLAIL